jgi:hypothetical protein
MSPKKSEPQFKLNYFDIIKGVLFPRMGVPKPQTPPPAPKPAQTTSTPPSMAPAAAAPPRSPVASPPPAATQSAAGGQTPSQTGPGGVKVDKLAPAFFNIAGILSFIVNIILIIVLVIVARQLFALKALVGDHLLGGLYSNFILMDRAHIKTNITVQDTIPIKFELPISQDTVVVLTQDTPIDHVLVQINTGSLAINSYARIVLPAQTNLPVHLALTVPVETKVPVTLQVPVDIPLEKTELHQPFIGLQGVVRPLYGMLAPNTKSPNDMPCGLLKPFCNWFFYK